MTLAECDAICQLVRVTVAYQTLYDRWDLVAPSHLHSAQITEVTNALNHAWQAVLDAEAHLKSFATDHPPEVQP